MLCKCLEHPHNLYILLTRSLISFFKVVLSNSFLSDGLFSLDTGTFLGNLTVYRGCFYCLLNHLILAYKSFENKKGMNSVLSTHNRQISILNCIFGTLLLPFYYKKHITCSHLV